MFPQSEIDALDDGLDDDDPKAGAVATPVARSAAAVGANPPRPAADLTLRNMNLNDDEEALMAAILAAGV